MYLCFLPTSLFISVFHPALSSVKTTRSRFDIVIVIDQSKSMSGRAECEMQRLIDKFHHIGSGKEDTRFGLVFCSAHSTDFIVPLEEGTNMRHLKNKLKLRRINRTGERFGVCFPIAKHLFVSDARPYAAKVVFVPFDGIIDPDPNPYQLENVAKPIVDVNATIFVLLWASKNLQIASQQIANMNTLAMKEKNRLLNLSDLNFDIVNFLEQYQGVGKREYRDCVWDWQDIPCQVDNKTRICQKMSIPYETVMAEPYGEPCSMPVISVTECYQPKFECPDDLPCGIRTNITVTVDATQESCSGTKLMECEVKCSNAVGKQSGKKQHDLLLPVMIFSVIIFVAVAVGFAYLMYRRQQKIKTQKGDSRSNSSKSTASRAEKLKSVKSLKKGECKAEFNVDIPSREYIK